MELKKLMVDTKAVWVDFAGLEDFKVEVVNLSRKELNALRKKCTTTKFDRKTRQAVEQIDEDKFVTEFTAAVVKNWKGLKLSYLESLLLVDIDGQDPEAELESPDKTAAWYADTVLLVATPINPVPAETKVLYPLITTPPVSKVDKLSFILIQLCNPPIIIW